MPALLEMVHLAPALGGTGQGGAWHYQSGPGGYAEYHFTGDDLDDMGDIFGDMFGGMFHGKSSGGSSRSRHFTGGSGFGGSGTHFTGGSSFGGSSAHFGGGSGFGGFGGSQGFHSADFREKGSDLTSDVTISFDEAVSGARSSSLCRTHRPASASLYRFTSQRASIPVNLSV